MSHPARLRQLSRACARAVVVLLAVAAVGGCSDSEAGQKGTASEEGPLVSGLGSGGNALDPPGPVPWSATFGSLTLCSPEPVTITEITPSYSYAEPDTIAFRLRAVPAITADRPGKDIDWAPIAARNKSLDQLVKSREVRSTTLTPAVGASVDQPCTDDPNASFIELVTTLTVGAAGTWIRGLDIAYESGDEEFNLKVDWNYVACGKAVTDREICG